MASPWPSGFDRVPDEPWTRDPVSKLALDYDRVGDHGWYENLDPTIDQVLSTVEDADRVLDYSAGTGILADRLVDRGLGPVGVLNVDASPKFLRLCLEKHREDERMAFRRLDYLSDEGRLAFADEVLARPIVDRGLDVITSTNAVHLYTDLEETLAGWRRVIREDGVAVIQSGNVDRVDRPDGRWVIDATVAAIAEEAEEIVRTDPRFEGYRDQLEEPDWRRLHRAYRRRVFPPIRSRGHYEKTFVSAGFEIQATQHRAIEVDVEEWIAFLQTYADAVLGWVGGAAKVTDRDPGKRVAQDRKTLITEATHSVFDAKPFQAEWTYWTLKPD